MKSRAFATGRRRNLMSTMNFQGIRHIVRGRRGAYSRRSIGRYFPRNFGNGFTGRLPVDFYDGDRNFERSDRTQASIRSSSLWAGTSTSRRGRPMAAFRRRFGHIAKRAMLKRSESAGSNNTAAQTPISIVAKITVGLPNH